MNQITVGGGIPLPLLNTLQVGIHKKDGTIVDIQAYTHNVDWVDSGLSVVRYCNVCGSAMFRIGHFACDDGVVRKAKVCVCKSFLGFIK